MKEKTQNKVARADAVIFIDPFDASEVTYGTKTALLELTDQTVKTEIPYSNIKVSKNFMKGIGELGKRARTIFSNTRIMMGADHIGLDAVQRSVNLIHQKNQNPDTPYDGCCSYYDGKASFDIARVSCVDHEPLIVKQMRNPDEGCDPKEAKEILGIDDQTFCFFITSGSILSCELIDSEIKSLTIAYDKRKSFSEQIPGILREMEKFKREVEKNQETGGLSNESPDSFPPRCPSEPMFTKPLGRARSVFE